MSTAEVLEHGRNAAVLLLTGFASVTFVLRAVRALFRNAS